MARPSPYRRGWLRTLSGWPMAVLTLTVLLGSIAFWGLGLRSVLPSPQMVVEALRNLVIRPLDYPLVWLILMLIIRLLFIPARDDLPDHTRAGALRWIGQIGVIGGFIGILAVLLWWPGQTESVLVGALVSFAVGAALLRIDYVRAWQRV